MSEFAQVLVTGVLLGVVVGALGCAPFIEHYRAKSKRK